MAIYGDQSVNFVGGLIALPLRVEYGNQLHQIETEIAVWSVSLITGDKQWVGSMKKRRAGGATTLLAIF